MCCRQRLLLIATIFLLAAVVVGLDCKANSIAFFFPDRDIKIVRPLYSVEIFETESARFDTEISEEDIHANWKLKGEPLTQSPVSKLSK